jgi:hypothetical protein
MVRHIEQHQWAGIVSVLCLTLAGCSGTPQNVMLDTPSGPVTLNAPPPPSGGLAEPPPNLMPAQPRPPAAGPVNLDGTYSGSMKVLVTNGNQCQSSTPVHDFTVQPDPLRRISWNYSAQRGPPDDLRRHLDHWSVQRTIVPCSG